MKNDSIPHFIHMKDMHGKFVAPKDRAETIAKYLEEKHWHNTNTLTVERQEKLQALEGAFNVDCFSHEEFEAALKSMKNNKQPGPDSLTMELFKWMNKQNRARILDIINGWWSTSRSRKMLAWLVLCHCTRKVIPIYHQIIDLFHVSIQFTKYTCA